MPAPTPSIPELVTTNEVAKTFSVTNETVRDWIAKGLLRGRKINRYWRVERDSMIELMNRKYGS